MGENLAAGRIHSARGFQISGSPRNAERFVGRLADALRRGGGFVDGRVGKFALTESVSPPRRRVSFWMPRKKPKRHQGAAQDERFALRFAAPGPHFYGGRQLGKLGGYRKGAGGQGIGFCSITAAAEFPATFGRCSYWLEARLLGWWGSSCAAGDDGRLIAAPATFRRSFRFCRRGRRPRRPAGAHCAPLRRKTDHPTRIVPLIRLAYGQPPSPNFRAAARASPTAKMDRER